MSTQELIDRYNAIEQEQAELLNQICTTLGQGTGRRYVKLASGEMLSNPALDDRKAVNKFVSRVSASIVEVVGG